MPTPNSGESRDDFIERCIPIVLEDGTAEDSDQAFAVCNSMYEQDSKQQAIAPPVNERNWSAEQTLEHVQGQGRKFTKEEAGYVQLAPLEDAQMACGKCTFYQGPDAQDVQHCAVVTGGIEWYGHSDLFIDRVQQEAVQRQNEGEQESDEMNKGTQDGPSEHKTLPFIVTKVDHEKGIVTHTIAVMGNVDLGGDVIHPGAFTKTITERMGKIRVLDSHNTDSVMRVVGKPIAMREVSGAELPRQVKELFPDANGALMAETQFLINTPEGKGVFERIKAGAVDEYSIGYDALDVDFEERVVDGEKQSVRNLRTVKLYEYSPVVFAMNPATSTVGVKGASGATNLPIASRERAWDADAAIAGIRRLTGSEDEPSGRYRRGFFWFDGENADQFGGYKLPFATDVGGELTAIPRGIFATAAVLAGARGGVDIPSGDLPAVRQRVSRYYARMREQFDDDGIVPPWEKALPLCIGKKQNLTELVKAVTVAFYSAYPDSFDQVWWVKQIHDAFLIVDQEGRVNATWRVPYTAEGSVINFSPKAEWEQVQMTFVPVVKESKVGRAISAARMSRIRGAIDTVQSALSDLTEMLAEVSPQEQESEETQEKGDDTQATPHQETPDEAGPDVEPPTSKDAMLAEIEKHMLELETMEA